MPYISVDVDVDLSDFDTEDLIEELDSRKSEYGRNTNQLLEAIWLKRRNGQPYDDLLDKLIYTELGKVL